MLEQGEVQISPANSCQVLQNVCPNFVQYSMLFTELLKETHISEPFARGVCCKQPSQKICCWIYPACIEECVSKNLYFVMSCKSVPRRSIHSFCRLNTLLRLEFYYIEFRRKLLFIRLAIRIVLFFPNDSGMIID